MNVEVLIDAIVRQTTVLIAQLATTAGNRTPLAHTANQMFVELVRELRDQGVTNPVIADMFGMALRSYHKKLRRLRESVTFRGQSLWTAILHHVSENGPVWRADVFHRFRNDDEANLRGVLNDMVETGVLYSSGEGDATAYRIMDAREFPASRARDSAGLAHLAWVAIYRFGPLTLEELAKLVPAPSAALGLTLETLCGDGRIQKDGTDRYGSTHCFIPVGSSHGWEAAVFDHYQAVVTTICRRLEQRGSASVFDAPVGGSTYRMSVWSGHPLRHEVMSLLERMRADVVQLRDRVERYNATHDAPEADGYEGVVFYLGQTVLNPKA